MVVGLPREEVVGGQFPDRRAGREWRLERSGVKMGDGLIRGGQSHIRKGRAFRSRAILGGVRKRQVLGRRKVGR